MKKITVVANIWSFEFELYNYIRPNVGHDYLFSFDIKMILIGCVPYKFSKQPIGFIDWLKVAQIWVKLCKICPILYHKW